MRLRLIGVFLASFYCRCGTLCHSKFPLVCTICTTVSQRAQGDVHTFSQGPKVFPWNSQGCRSLPWNSQGTAVLSWFVGVCQGIVTLVPEIWATNEMVTFDSELNLEKLFLQYNEVWNYQIETSQVLRSAENKQRLIWPLISRCRLHVMNARAQKTPEIQTVIYFSTLKRMKYISQAIKLHKTSIHDTRCNL